MPTLKNTRNAMNYLKYLGCRLTQYKKTATQRQLSAVLIVSAMLPDGFVMAQQPNRMEQQQNQQNQQLELDIPAQDLSSALNASSIEEVNVIGSYVVNDRLDTATGLGLTLQETPQSVSIVTFQQIEDQGLRSLTDVVNNAPGISSKAFDSSRNGFSARGFDVDNYQIDGVPVQWDGGASAGETQTDTALYERIEIVRGATGLLTGAGNPSASINLVRKHANSTELTGAISSGASRWNTYNTTVDVSTPLNSSGSVRGRAVFVYEEGESYVDLLENKKSVYYAVVDADLTENTLLSVGASYQDNEPTSSLWGGLPIFYSDGTRTDWSRSRTIGADWTYWATEHETYFANISHEFASGWEVKFNLNRTQSSSDMRLVFFSGAPDRDTGLGMRASPRRFDNERTQDDFGVRVTGTYELLGRDHDLVLGVTHSEQDFIYNRFVRGAIADVGNFNQWDGSYPEPEWGAQSPFEDQTTKQTGYYTASQFSLTESLKVIVGARVADWERVGENFGQSIDYGDSGVFIPYTGILYDLNDQHVVYSSYTEIFEPQNAQDRNGDYLDPLAGKNYEIGLKSRFFNNALHTTVTLFKAEQDNLAIPDGDFRLPGTEAQASRPTNGVESDGFELEMVGELIPGWSISANYTQFDVKAEAPNGESNTVNTRYPRKLFRLFTTYQLEKLTLGGGVSWEGSNYTEVTNPGTGLKEKAEQSDFSLVNVMARYLINEQLSAQVNIDNLLDETYHSQIGFFTQLAYGEPRNINVNLKYQF